MVIRRIRAHVTAHNWFAVGIDLVIVVAGVFLGTQANNWNEARLEREQGRSYRERLIEDLRSNFAPATFAKRWKRGHGDSTPGSVLGLTKTDLPVMGARFGRCLPARLHFF